MRKKLLDIWAHVEPRFGGVGPAASQLAAVVHAVSGWESRLIAVCDRGENQRHDGIAAHVECIRTSHVRPVADIVLRRALVHAVGECDICHIHGLWTPHALAARHLARQYRKGLVSSVHGALSPWELHKKNKWLKKAVYSLLFEKPSLAGSHCIRALTMREAEDCRRYGLRNPIAVVPTGVAPIQRAHHNVFFDRFPLLAGKLIVLYLGRVHYQKGVIDLAQAWAKACVRHSGAHLVIVGPDHGPTRKQLDEIVIERQLGDSVTFTGMLTGEMKIGALSAARYFCLPSYSEALSVAALEALSIGLPVIVTPSCNMDDITPYGAGVVTCHDPDVLADTLSQCLSLGDEKWMAMSRGAMRLARERYDWEQVANKMYSVYCWILGGPKPDCVID